MNASICMGSSVMEDKPNMRVAPTQAPSHHSEAGLRCLALFGRGEAVGQLCGSARDIWKQHQEHLVFVDPVEQLAAGGFLIKTESLCCKEFSMGMLPRCLYSDYSCL